LPSLQLFLHSLANEIRPVLAIPQHSFDPSERSVREARLHIFTPLSLSAHISE
jgi:hypothetical protein